MISNYRELCMYFHRSTFALVGIGLTQQKLFYVLVLFFTVSLSGLFQGELVAQIPSKSEMDLLNNSRPFRVSDRLWYHVIEEREQPVRLFVNDRGFVDVPYINEVYALGKTPRQLAYEIKTLLEVDFFYQATVIINLREGDNTRGEITILGEVAKAGKHKVPSDQVMYVSDAILAAGNMTDGADGRGVTLVRQDPNDPDVELRFIVDVQGILETGRYEYDMAVEPDDLIIVPRKVSAGGQVYITGEVRSPGLYPIPPNQDFTVSRAILAAGGFGQWARKDKVKLIRAGDMPAQERTLIIDVGKILEQNIRDFDPVVNPGDVIRVDERMFTF